MALLGTDNVQVHSLQDVIDSLKELQEDEEEYVVVLGKYIHAEEDFTVKASDGEDDPARIGPFAYPGELWEDSSDIRTSVNHANTQLIGTTMVPREDISEMAEEIAFGSEEDEE